VKILLRLLRYAAPYRLRLSWAIAAMLVYAAASALLAAQIKRIFDVVLPHQEQVGQVAVAIIGLYLLKGIGAYFSDYLMTDVGQRVVRDLRDQLHRHMVGQSAAFFARRTTGQLLSRLTNDVGQVQHVVAETVGDLLQEGFGVIGCAALLFYYDARLAMVCVTAAPIIVYPLAKLGRRLRKTSRRSQEALEHLTHVAGEAYTGHPDREGVRRGGARGREIPEGVRRAVPHEHACHAHCVGPSPDHGDAGRLRDRGRALLRRAFDCDRTPHER
jgi:subfamily B ATP-binding cassette protein MsbA